MEKWIEIVKGYENDGFPRFAYIHDSCGKLSYAATPYCPLCGKRITHMDISHCGGLEISSVAIYKDKFICELLSDDND